VLNQAPYHEDVSWA